MHFILPKLSLCNTVLGLPNNKFRTHRSLANESGTVQRTKKEGKRK